MPNSSVPPAAQAAHLEELRNAALAETAAIADPAGEGRHEKLARTDSDNITPRKAPDLFAIFKTLDDKSGSPR